MYRVELKDLLYEVDSVSINVFLMYRVELKGDIETAYGV